MPDVQNRAWIVDLMEEDKKFLIHFQTLQRNSPHSLESSLTWKIDTDIPLVSHDWPLHSRAHEKANFLQDD